MTILGKYVDSLYLSVQGRLQDGFVEDLRAEKEAMRELGDTELESYSIPGFLPGPLRLGVYSRGKYEFVLVNEVLDLAITGRADLPKLFIKFHCQVLYEHGLEALEGMVGEVAGFFLEPGFDVSVNRFDLAVDFQGQEDWQPPDVDDVICKAKEPNVDYRTVRGKKRPATLTYGKYKSGTLQVQLYDKSHYMKTKGEKGWMHEVWRESGEYTEGLAVWRLESRFLRKRLRQAGIKGVADLRARLGDLARVVVGGEGIKPWIRVASPDTREKRQDHRPSAPWWEEIREAFLKGVPASGHTIQRPQQGPDLTQTETNLDAYFERFVVQGGGEGLHPESSIEEFLDLYKGGYLKRLDKRDLSFVEAIDLRRKKMGLAPIPSATPA